MIKKRTSTHFIFDLSRYIYHEFAKFQFNLQLQLVISAQHLI